MIEEMDAQFKKIIAEKDQAFLIDITTLDNKYNNVLYYRSTNIFLLDN